MYGCRNWFARSDWGGLAVLARLGSTVERLRNHLQRLPVQRASKTVLVGTDGEGLNWCLARPSESFGDQWSVDQLGDQFFLNAVRWKSPGLHCVRV